MSDSQSEAADSTPEVGDWDPHQWLEVDDGTNGGPANRTPTGSTIPDTDFVVEENGRTFNDYRGGRYFLPNDGEEQDRLDLQHEVFRLTLDGALHLAPVERPTRVLDVATGTGIWALEFASLHPESQVLGTDLSLIQPEDRRKLPNCDFVREDSEELWVHDLKFDYVHLRAVVTCFTDTRTVIQQAYEHMNEGAWIEFQDPPFFYHAFDDTYEGTSMHQAMEGVRQAFQKIGRDVDKPMQYKQWLIEAGFVDVEEKMFPVPLSPWPADPKFKQLGKWQCANMSPAIVALANKMLPIIGYSAADAQELADKAVLDIQNTEIHAYIRLFVVWGRKPFQSEQDTVATYQ